MGHGMQVNRPLANLPRSGVHRAPQAVGNAAKSGTSGQLGTPAHNQFAQKHKPAPRLQVDRVSQDDTDGFDPFWDGPRLKPIFVAQLLGQAMPAQRPHLSVDNAYGKAAVRTALLVDRKS
jgi:hypothetical protein